MNERDPIFEYINNRFDLQKDYIDRMLEIEKESREANAKLDFRFIMSLMIIMLLIVLALEYL